MIIKIKRLSKFNLIIDCCAEAAVEISRKNLDKVFNTNLIGTFNILKKQGKINQRLFFCHQVELIQLKRLIKLQIIILI